jgi:beta-N-acetylhexosaminidase
LVQKVADQSVTLLKNNGSLPLKAWDPAKAVHITIQKDEIQPNVAELVKSMTAAFPGMAQFSLKPGGSESLRKNILWAARNADLIILSFLVQRTRHGDPAPLREDDISLIRKITAKKSLQVVAMSFGNPHLIRKLDDLPAFLAGYGEGGWYGNQPVYFDSYIRILKGELVPAGRLPVRVSDQYPIGHGLTYQ